jgi:hypothetical protein
VSKGSNQRPLLVPRSTFGQEFDRIFNPDNGPTDDDFKCTSCGEWESKCICEQPEKEEGS